MMTRSLSARVLAPTCLALTLAASLPLGGCRANPYPYRLRGDGAMEGGNYPLALESYQKYIEIDPGSPDMRNALGRAYLASNRPVEAIEHLRVATLQAPENDQYMDDLAEAYVRANRADEMYRLLRSNANERGGVRDWIRLGRFAEKSGDADVARQALLTAARVDRGQNLAPQLALHDFFVRIGDARNADQRLRMAYFISPRDPGVLRRLADAGVADIPANYGFVPAERLEARALEGSAAPASAAPANQAR